MEKTKISLLGDSIREIGYGTVVPELLGEAYEVWQPSSNCRFASYLLRGLWDWKDAMAGSRVVHFNCGLWDVCELFGDGMFTPLEVYTDTVLRIAKILLSRHEHVIFATTTPVNPAFPYNDNAKIRMLNDAVVPRLREMGVRINDLHAVVASDIGKYITTDMLHLSPAGIDVCAKATIDAIRSVL